MMTSALLNGCSHSPIQSRTLFPPSCYHAMVTHVDDVVGALVDALRQKGMLDNVLFMASNDTHISSSKGANNYPLKEGKASDWPWQGGVRVNTLVSAGGYLP